LAREKRAESSSALIGFIRRLFFREAILEPYDAVVGALVLGVLAEVADTDELELVAALGLVQGGLDHGVFQLGQRVGVEEVEVRLALGHVSRVFNIEQSVVQHKGGRTRCVGRSIDTIAP